MGQYHKVVNLDKKMWLNPHSFDDGTKLMEFGQSAGGTMTALAILLAPQSANGGRGGGDMHTDREGIVGSWAGDRIAIVGDYAEPGDKEGWDAERDQPLYCTLMGYGKNADGEWVEGVDTDGWIDISSLVFDLMREAGETREQVFG